MDDINGNNNWWQLVGNTETGNNLAGFTNQPFCGDQESFNHVQELTTKYNIQTILELGTYRGTTTKKFTEIVPQVIGIEYCMSHLLKTFHTCINKKNLLLRWGKSYEEIPHIVSDVKGRLLIFIDSHWFEKDIPVIKELKVLTEYFQDNCLLVIDDIQVPERDDAFWHIPTTFKGDMNPLYFSFNFIKSSLEELYPQGYDYYYNDKISTPNQERRFPGKMFVIPHKWKL